MTPADVLTDLSGREDLLEAEAGAVAHMNADHADAVELYARAFCAAAAGPWQLAGLDPEGLDLVRGDQMQRLWFETPLGTAEDLRPLRSDARRVGEECVSQCRSRWSLYH